MPITSKTRGQRDTYETLVDRVVKQTAHHGQNTYEQYETITQRLRYMWTRAKLAQLANYNSARPTRPKLNKSEDRWYARVNLRATRFFRVINRRANFELDAIEY